MLINYVIVGKCITNNLDKIKRFLHSLFELRISFEKKVLHISTSKFLTAVRE